MLHHRAACIDDLELLNISLEIILKKNEKRCWGSLQWEVDECSLWSIGYEV